MTVTFKGLKGAFYHEGGEVIFEKCSRFGIQRTSVFWRSVTTNFTISHFDFDPRMKIWVYGNQAAEVGTWRQTQVNKAGAGREIAGRATILWKKVDGHWRVWHYHASITPPRSAPRPVQ